MYGIHPAKSGDIFIRERWAFVKGVRDRVRRLHVGKDDPLGFFVKQLFRNFLTSLGHRCEPKPEVNVRHQAFLVGR